jgi:hypothetical protein
MRWPLFFFVLALPAAACDWPAATDTGGSATTDAGTSQCAAANPSSCDDCQSCAENGPCATEVADCNSDPNCQYILSCAVPCGSDATCLQACYAQNSEGETAYEALATCLYCDQCTCSGLCGG